MAGGRSRASTELFPPFDPSIVLSNRQFVMSLNPNLAVGR